MNFAQIVEGSVMREKREEKREKKGKKRERREKTVAKGRKVRCDDFFLLLQAFQVLYKW